MQHTHTREREMKKLKLESKINEKKLTIIWICVTIDDKSAGADENQHQQWIHRHLFSLNQSLIEKNLPTQKTK